MEDKLRKLECLNSTLKSPKELGGVFLPRGFKKQFDFIFIAEMPSMQGPKERKLKNENYNFNITARDRFLQEMMVKYKVDGSYATDIVKERDIPRYPTREEIKKWLSFLLKEIKIIHPKVIIVLGKRTYATSFRPFVESFISKDIKVEYVFHYSGQVSRKKFEQRFSDVVNRSRNDERLEKNLK